VEGKLQTFSWVDKDGVKRYMTKVVVSRVVFLSGHGGRRNGRREDDPPEPPPPNYGHDREGDDEIPF
jgi:single-stranded DNA-binding protein